MASELPADNAEWKTIIAGGVVSLDMLYDASGNTELVRITNRERPGECLMTWAQWEEFSRSLGSAMGEILAERLLDKLNLSSRYSPLPSLPAALT